jgi:microcystin-dependent protein
MSQPFIGEIRMFGGSFAPAGWAFCDGQSIPISENDALFVLLGTTYGGDGQETFNLPNLQSRVPIHAGTNPQTGNNYQLGEMGGVESVTLTIQQIPSHNHPQGCKSGDGNSASPANAVPANNSTALAYGSVPPPANMNPASTGISGGSQPHDNLQPYLTVSFIISLFGIFPHQ